MAAHNFENSLAHVLKHEGGFVDHPADPGGATNMGITRATLARARNRPVTAADVRALTRAGGGDDLPALLLEPPCAADDLPAGLDHAVFDLAVNSGPARAAKLLQRVLGVAEDGVIGPATLAAARRAAAATSDPGAPARAPRLPAERLATWPVFGRGWRSAASPRSSARPSRSSPPRRRRLLLLPPVQPPAPKGHGMTDVKSILASRTVWTNIVGLVSVGARHARRRHRQHRRGPPRRGRGPARRRRKLHRARRVFRDRRDTRLAG